jgi:multidrug resistance efflux pump
VKYYSGEEVKKDEVLITLDSQELFLKKVEAQADVTRFLAEAEKARASKELANMNISIARMEQAQSILERTKYYLEQSQIKSPFDGIIVDGDKKQLTGTPVSKGDLLIKVANPSNQVQS